MTNLNGKIALVAGASRGIGRSSALALAKQGAEVLVHQGRDVTLGMQALKRIAQSDDIAGAVPFLAADNARWVTGDTLHVDGGSKL
jgi:NAD(P)-dependent dehydrogenase (short-subunit alcohol dehydrogenase family)